MCLSVFEIIELFQGSVFSFLISLLGNDSGPLIRLPHLLHKTLFPLSKKDYARVSSVLLRFYAILSAVICAISILLPPEKLFYVPSLATFIAVLSISLSIEMFLWTKSNWSATSVWKLMGALILIMFMVCFAILVILLDVLA